MKKEKIDLTGQQFGDWTVISETSPVGYGRRWICRCVCGEERIVFQGNLIRRLSTGCGCRARKQTSIRAGTHRKRNTRLYVVWCGMRRRCYSPKDDVYSRYGARGITVCDEWLGEDGFQNFWDWAYANGYDENAPKGQCTLDRIDNDGPYAPWNCRWVDMFAQARNKSNTNWVIDGDEVLSFTGFCEKYNVSPSLVRERIARGWSMEEAWFFPPKEMSSAIEYDGETKSGRAWAKHFGIHHNTFNNRLLRGWTFEQAAGIAPPPDRNRNQKEREHNGTH